MPEYLTQRLRGNISYRRVPQGKGKASVDAQGTSDLLEAFRERVANLIIPDSSPISRTESTTRNTPCYIQPDFVSYFCNNNHEESDIPAAAFPDLVTEIHNVASLSQFLSSFSTQSSDNHLNSAVTLNDILDLLRKTDSLGCFH